MSRRRERQQDERRGRREAFEAARPDARLPAVDRAEAVKRDYPRQAGFSRSILARTQDLKRSASVVPSGVKSAVRVSRVAVLPPPDTRVRLSDVNPVRAVAPSVVKRAEALRAAEVKAAAVSEVDAAASLVPSASLSEDNRRVMQDNGVSLVPEDDKEACLSANRPRSNRGSGGSRFIPWCQKGKK